MNALTHIRADNVPTFAAYERIIVALSGGKDSIAAALLLLDYGVPKHKIEFWHHDVDGNGQAFMDWPVTLSYCRAFARHLGIPLFRSYKEGGFLRELERDNARTAPMAFEVPSGFARIGGTGGKCSTRLKFPQVSADLSVRWCSAYLKIDVMDSAIRNQPRFLNSATLIVTGERAEESPARSRYKVFEPHRSDARDGKRVRRHVDHWRPVHGLREAAIWDIMSRHGIVPHLAYQLGWGRLSCMKCIFGSPNQWATIEMIDPAGFEEIAGREERFGVTIQRKRSVRELARVGTPYRAAVERPDLVALAMATEWTAPIYVDPEKWRLPAGAFGESAGPT